MKDTWYDMGFDADMSWMYDWKEKEKEMGISESKKKIVIDNYFKKECDVNTSIKEAFTKGFELGLKKAPIPSVEPYKKIGTLGHWIETSRGFECNQCHGIDTDELESPYCKWCGTKMKGVIENE